MVELTPMEDLMVEALLARYRLGEKCWAFDSRTVSAANKLEAKGLVSWKAGVVQHTIIVWWTPAFIEEFAAIDYLSPRYAGLLTAARRVLRQAGKFCDACDVGSIRPKEHRMCEASARHDLRKALEKLGEQ